MKAVLFVCLLAFIACANDIIDIGVCIYQAPIVQELISDVVVAIATQDYSQLLARLQEALPQLVQVVLGCLTNTNALKSNQN